METYKPWGKSIAINLHGCAHDRLTDAALLGNFVQEIIKVVGMEPYGPCHIDRFEVGPGLSAMQFLTTSALTVHLDEIDNRAFIDLFSCKDFDGAAAEKYAKDFFQATKATSTVLDR